MTTREELLRQRAAEATAVLQRGYAASRQGQTARAAAAKAAPAGPTPQVLLEDSAARVISSQHGIAIDEVMVNGRRYGDIVAARG